MTYTCFIGFQTLPSLVSSSDVMQQNVSNLEYVTHSQGVHNVRSSPRNIQIKIEQSCPSKINICAHNVKNVFNQGKLNRFKHLYEQKPQMLRNS